MATFARLTVSPTMAMADANLLGDGFTGPSWARWRAILKAAYAEPLDAAELALFREVAEREPPGRPVRELWCKVGRRGGKDFVASAIATCAALGDYRSYLRPGERATVLCLAVDRDQARIVFRYIKAAFAKSLLAPLVEHETDDGLELSNGNEIIVAPNSFRAVRGRTIVCAIFDEVAYWRDSDSATPDVEVFAAVLPGMATLPEALLIGISTPYRRSGLLYTKWQQHYSKADDDVLVVGGASRTFNPTLDEGMIARALERDPEAARAEWLAEWRSDISDFLDRELVETAVDVGVQARPPAVHRYFAFADLSGGRGDSFTCAVAHGESKAVLLDAIYERRPPFDPSSVVAEVAALLRSYGLREVTGDNYGAEWVVEAFFKEGIRYVKADRDRSKIYLDALPLFTSGRARLLDNKRLAHQFIALERRTSRMGRDTIRHPEGGHDDLANACSGALVVAAAQAAPALWCRDDLLIDDAPVPLPSRASALYVSAAVDTTGTAFCYWATNDRYPGAAPLLLLDFDVAQPLRFDTVLTRLRELMTLIDASSPGLFSTANLSYHAEVAGLPANAMGDKLLADRPRISLAVAAEISRGRVKISATAWQKAQRQPLPFDFQIDAKPSAGADAALIGIAAALPPEALPSAV